MYMLQRAHLIQEYEKEAESRGEVFHTANTYYDFGPKLWVQARIKALPGMQEKVLVLIIRHIEGEDHEQEVTQLAHVLLVTKVQRVTPSYAERGWRHHVFYTEHIPPPLSPKSQPVSQPAK